VPDVNAAELVRAVRKSENWIHQVDSLTIRIESKWTKTPKAIAASRAELKKQFPDLDPDPEHFWELKPSYKGSLEYAFDQRRLRFLHETPGKSSALKIWDGKQATSLMSRKVMLCTPCRKELVRIYFQISAGSEHSHTLSGGTRWMLKNI
jgi:hypothetical protein